MSDNIDNVSRYCLKFDPENDTIAGVLQQKPSAKAILVFCDTTVLSIGWEALMDCCSIGTTSEPKSV